MSLRAAIAVKGARAWRRGLEGGQANQHDAGTIALKGRIHEKLLTRFDMAALESLPPDALRRQLKLVIEELLDEEAFASSLAEREQIITSIQDEVTGLGPLEPLLADASISDVLVNGYATVYVERGGKLELTNTRFHDNAHLLKIIERIVSPAGRRVDESSPMVDARLPDGSRVNAVIAPLSLDGPALSIRRFSARPLALGDLIRHGALSEAMAQVIEGLVKAKVNLLISGGTGSGKTTLLNALSASIPSGERIVTIEDAAELRLQQPHVVRLETRSANIEGTGEVTQRALVRNCLRMRPDRIVIGEVRGGEVLDMLQAMNTGHEGSMTTVHANTPRDALMRLENMAGMAGIAVPGAAFRQQVVSAIAAVIQVARLSDGKRKIVSVDEVMGIDGDSIATQAIFTFRQSGTAADGTVLGVHAPTGAKPAFLQRLRLAGIALGDNLFAPPMVLPFVAATNTARVPP
jgi:pilus assembly protein CpaF